MLNQVYPLEHFERFKVEWNKKSPKQKWRAIYDFGGRLSETSVGIRVFSDMKVYWFSYLGGTVSFFHVVFIINTLWVYYKKDDLLRGMQSTCTMGMLITVSNTLNKLNSKL